ncbi:MAG: hypothetical protein ABI743_11900 [bacterium]
MIRSTCVVALWFLVCLIGCHGHDGAGLGLVADTVAVTVTGDMVSSGDRVLLTAEVIPGLEIEDRLLDIDWNGDGRFDGIDEADHQLTVETPLELTSPAELRNPLRITESRTLHYRYRRDGQWPATTDIVAFTLGPNRPPEVTGAPVLEKESLEFPAQFRILPGTLEVHDPEGDAFHFKITNNPIATGAFYLTCDFNPGAGVFNLSTAGGQDVFVTKTIGATGLW